MTISEAVHVLRCSFFLMFFFVDSMGQLGLLKLEHVLLRSLQPVIGDSDHSGAECYAGSL